jgi:NodT family efflux transporter outer membrane factor (OMF) lipoprotein
VKALALGFLSVTLLASGCATIPASRHAAAITPAASLAAERSFAGASVTDDWPQADWWHALADPQLDALIAESLAGSPSLKVAQARTREALARAGIADAARYPQLQAGLNVTRERFSANGIYPPPYGGRWNTLSELSATLAWDLDLWGVNRNAAAAARDAARATAIDADAARLALSANVALAYVQLERAYLELDVAQATLEQREQIYALTRDRTTAGIDSRLELKQAESALPATRAQVTQLEETITLTRNALAALLGKGPDRGAEIARPAARALAEVTIPSRLPAELLGRRPDIAAQRWRIEAARRDVESAKGTFYPNINLTAIVGFQNLGPGAFLSAANRELGAGPALSLPIFDAGRRRANLATKDAGYDVAVERSVAAQRAEQQQALATADEAYQLALLRYREGVGNYLQVLSTETQLLAQRSLDVELRARALDVSINLARALGGGFDEQSQPAAARPGV